MFYLNYVGCKVVSPPSQVLVAVPSFTLTMWDVKNDELDLLGYEIAVLP